MRPLARDSDFGIVTRRITLTFVVRIDRKRIRVGLQWTLFLLGNWKPEKLFEFVFDVVHFYKIGAPFNSIPIQIFENDFDSVRLKRDVFDLQNGQRDCKRIEN